MVRDAEDDFVAAWTAGMDQDGSQFGVLGIRQVALRPIAGKKLLMADNADPTKRKMLLQSKDPAVSTAPELGIDPIANGATLQVFNDAGSGESVCIDLPSSGSTVSGSGVTRKFKYKDKSGAYGPCRTAILKTGKPLKVLCQATDLPIAYTLDEPTQGAVGARLISNSRAYCMRFGGDVRRDEPVGSGGKFLAKDATAPVPCPVPPVSCP